MEAYERVCIYGRNRAVKAGVEFSNKTLTFIRRSQTKALESLTTNESGSRPGGGGGKGVGPGGPAC